MPTPAERCGEPAHAAVARDHALTFADLFAQLGAPAGRRYVNRWARHFIVRAVVARTPGRLAELANDPTSIDSVARALHELRSAGVTGAHLSQLPQTAELATARALLATYEEALDAMRLCDDADRQREAVLRVASGRSSLLTGLQEVSVEGGGPLFGARLDLLRAFAARGAAVRIRLPYDSCRREAFAWPEAGLHHIEAQAHSGPRLEVSLDSRTGGGALLGLRRAQFRGDVALEAPARIVRVASLREHAQAAAAAVMEWLRRGVPPHRIAVATVDRAVGIAVAQELAELGVPAQVAQGCALASTRAGRALLLALEAPLRGCLRDDILALWWDLERTVATPHGRLGPAEVAAMLRRAGVRSSRVGGYTGPLLAAASGARSSDAAREQATAVALAIEQLLGALADVPDEAPLHAALRAARLLLQALFVGETVAGARQPGASLPGASLPGASQPGAPAAELAARAPRALLEALEDQPVASAAAADAGALEQVADLLQELEEAARVPCCREVAITRRELAALVRFALQQERLTTAAPRAAAVEVVDIEDLVETHVAHLVLAGIDGGAFPRARAADPILPEEARAAINRHLGVRVLQASGASGREPLRPDARDYWLWLEALASCDEDLVVTVTRADTTKGEAGESDVVRELRRSLGGAVCDFAPPHVSGRLTTLAQARRAWAYGAGGRDGGPRLHPVAPAAMAALEALLHEEDPMGLRRLELRIARERERGRYGAASPLGAGARTSMARQLLDRVQTTSMLDTLGVCAFRFLAAAVLGLERDEVPRLGADPREEGNAAHAALCLVYRDLVVRGGMVAARLDPQGTLARAREVCEQHRNDILLETSIHPLLRAAAFEGAWRAVEVRLRADLARDDAREPVELEYKFGDRPGCRGRALAVPDPRGGRSVRARGGVDRIDGDATSLVVVDYKRTIKTRSPGRHFQLPLYLAAALRDFGERAERAEAAWSDLRSGKEQGALAEPAEAKDFAAQLAASLWARLAPLLAGSIAADPDSPAMCKWCDFQPLCRYAPVAMADLDGEAAEADAADPEIA